MNFVKDIIIILKKIFNKKENIKMIDEPVLNIKKENNRNFKKELKIDKSINQKNNNIETLVCSGDGLGIKTKIEY